MKDRKEFAFRSFIAASIALGVTVLLVALWFGRTLLLLVFAGVLLSIALRGPAEWISGHTRLPYGWSLTAVLIALCIVLTLLGVWIGPNLASQVDQLVESLPQSLASLKTKLSQYRWGAQLLQESSQVGAMLPKPGDVRSSVGGLFSATVRFIADVVIVLAIGIFIAAQPHLYGKAVLRLFPPASRGQLASVMDEIQHVLQRWLLARLVAMTLVGFLTGLGLWLLGIPLALTLAALVMALGFIPNIGPVLAALPALLLALTLSPMKMLYVLLLYIGVQTLEGYVITPLIQQRAISMPPALLISAQVYLGLLFGFLGLLLATPATAAALVVIRAYYLEDLLGERRRT